MEIKLANDLLKDSIVDGEGIRCVLWTQGCLHHCPFCHNPETHDITKGIATTTDYINNEIDKLEIHDGITFSGGEPFLQVKPLIEIAKHIKELGLNIWCYTGYTFEELLEDDEKLELLKYIDVLVDGKFDYTKKSLNVKFRGSSNQRIIDVKKSLKNKKAAIIKKYKNETKSHLPKPKKEYMFL